MCSWECKCYASAANKNAYDKYDEATYNQFGRTKKAVEDLTPEEARKYKPMYWTSNEEESVKTLQMCMDSLYVGSYTKYKSIYSGQNAGKEMKLNIRNLWRLLETHAGCSGFCGTSFFYYT